MSKWTVAALGLIATGVAVLVFSVLSVSTNNSTATALGAGATWTGTGEYNEESHVAVQVYADAPGTLFLDFSTDGTNWDVTTPPEGFAVASGSGDFVSLRKAARWFRARYVNGSVAQSEFRLESYFGDFAALDAYAQQVVSPGNSQTVTSAEAAPSSPWVGSWEPTRNLGIVRQLIVLTGSTSSIDGTFTFEYGEDGSTATISEARAISDFETVRDFDLLNAGAYFRVKFEPGSALGSESVIVTTTYRKSFDGAFVRLAGQQIEEANAAMGQTFAYLKAFVQATGKSTNIRADSDGNLITGDPFLQISRGVVTDHIAVRKFGANPTVNASSEEDVWYGLNGAGGTYTGWLTAATTVRVRAGGNAADTAAGAGAQQVIVVGLDASWNEASVTLDTAGASASAASATTFIRVYRVYVGNVGTYSNANVGDITIESSGGTVLGGIQAGRGQSQMSMFTIPDGYDAYLKRFRVTVDGNKAADVFMYQRQNADDVSTPFTSSRLLIPITQLVGTATDEVFAMDSIPPRTDLWWRASTGSGNSAAVSAAYDLVLVARN